MRRIARWLVVAWLAAGTASAGLPETPRPQQLTVADGLSSNRINAVAEDASGYLWIATSDGLVRYDGIGYRIWRLGQGLRDSYIWAVHVDARNRVWIGTRHAGLAMFDADRQRFVYYDRKSQPRVGSDEIWSIASTRDGALWFGTSDAGLYRLDAEGRMTRFMPRAGDPRSLPDAGVGQLVLGPDGALWAGTKNGVARWTGRDFARLPASALNSPNVNALRFDQDGTLWIGTPRGVSAVYPDGQANLDPWPGYAKKVYALLLTDRAGNRWLDTADGLGRDEEGEVRNVPLYSEVAHGMIRPSWSGAYQDREGGLWFASSDGGLWFLPSDWTRFSVLARMADDPDSMGNAYVRGIAPSANGDMWLIGSGGVLDRLDPESGRIRHVLANAGDGWLPTDVLEDRAGTVWIGYYHGLARLDPATGALKRWTADDAVDPALPWERQYMAEAGDGTLWFATEAEGVQARDPQGRIVESVPPDGRRGLSADDKLVQVDAGPDGAVWLAGSRGVSMWNAGTRRFERVPGSPPDASGRFTVAGDEVWVGGSGLLERYRWDGARLRLEQRFGAAEGLPQLMSNGLVVDHDGIVWLTTLRGLVRFDPVRRSARIYGVRDGLPGQEFGERPVARPQDGRILASTPEGLILFNPGVLHPTTTPPMLVLEAASVVHGDRRMLLDRDRGFALDHDDRDLRVTARLPTFNDARTHRYRFRLRPYDTEWVEVGPEGERVFPRLEPGDYVLQVQGKAGDNVWSKTRTLRFRVLPPWWRTAWAYAGFGLLGILLVAWAAIAYRRRLQRRHAWQLAEHKRELAEQASDAKSRFLATLGHEVRTPMTGVLGMSELLQSGPLDQTQRGQVDAIRRAGEHLLRLVNDALDLARIEAGKLQLDPVDFELRGLVEEVAGLMAPLAAQRGLRFATAIDPSAPKHLRADRGRVSQILLNLIGNAIKFTEEGEVALAVSPLSPQGVRFDVRDSGPGLNEEQKARLFRRFEQAEGARTAARYGGSGLGLAISQELAAAMGGRIDVDSAPGQGTRFIVELPVPRAESPSRAVEARPARGANPATGALRLLLVEDDPTVAEVVSGLLRAQGHEVVHALHGLAALAEVASADFDLGLLDLDLPGLDGLALARALRARGFDKPLVAVTARADGEAEPAALAAGFDGFLRKPVTGAMLADAIAEAMSNRRN
jgi:signal transduction histidine kinase/ligand-binding sensor domain-containing protein/CheY-like chemotaxis protein